MAIIVVILATEVLVQYIVCVAFIDMCEINIVLFYLINLNTTRHILYLFLAIRTIIHFLLVGGGVAEGSTVHSSISSSVHLSGPPIPPSRPPLPAIRLTLPPLQGTQCVWY